MVCAGMSVVYPIVEAVNISYYRSPWLEICVQHGLNFLSLSALLRAEWQYEVDRSMITSVIGSLSHFYKLPWSMIEYSQFLFSKLNSNGTYYMDIYTSKDTRVLCDVAAASAQGVGREFAQVATRLPDMGQHPSAAP